MSCGPAAGAGAGGEAEQHCAEAQVPLATPADRPLVQRASTCARTLVPLRMLGQGAFACVDLVRVHLGPDKAPRLLVRKTLNPEPSQTAPAPRASSPRDWTREAAMHRLTEGSPFVLQLLAAKKCRAGKLLLLTEFAEGGSLTSLLEQQRQQLRRQGSGQQLLLQQQQEEQPAGERGGDAAQQPVLVVVGDEAGSGGGGTAALQAAAGGDSSAPLAVVIHGLELALDGPGAPPGEAEQPQPQPHQLEHQQQQQDPEPQAQQQRQRRGLGSAAGCASCGSLMAAGQGACAGPAASGLGEDAARFYAACVLLALQWLHARRIMHRDVKPCNLLLMRDGYLKLADLGCCVQLPEGVDAAHTRTGSAGYWAPEVAAPRGGGGYDFGVDLWSLGVTLWECVAGDLPCWASLQQQAAHADAAHRHYTPELLVFPPGFSQELCELLRGLLAVDAEHRYDIEAAKAAAWFAGFPWDELAERTLQAPPLPGAAV